MFSAFRLGPAASGRGRRDINKVFSELVNHLSKNREVLIRRKYTNSLGF